MTNFNTSEEAVAYAMSIEPKPKFFRDKHKYQRRTAFIGRYGTYPSYCKVTSLLFGKYFLDIQGVFGSENGGIPESFPTYDEARTYLEGMGFVPAE